MGRPDCFGAIIPVMKPIFVLLRDARELLNETDFNFLNGNLIGAPNQPFILETFTSRLRRRNSCCANYPATA